MKTKNKEKERVLVTGASGFIGSHLVEVLINKGYYVICLVLPGEDMKWIKNLNVECLYGDITDKNLLYDHIENISYIYHLAAVLSGYDFEEMCRINYGGTRNLIEVCLEKNIDLKRFVLVSSNAVVGPTKKNDNFTENEPCNPVTDYGKSKLMAEKFLKRIKKRIPFTIIRLPVVYGPRSFGGLFTCFKLINKGIQLDIGEAETNLIFVKDAVNGIIKAVEHEKTINQTYFFGEERVYNLNEVNYIIKKVLSKNPLKIKIPMRLLYMIAIILEFAAKITGTPPILRRAAVTYYLKYRYWRYSTLKAKQEFGFKPEVPIELGLKITADWYKKHGFI
jgi:nucleoside-diphosphate-sugar epimerase